PAIEQLAVVQLLSVERPEIEQTPELVQVLWLVMPEIEQAAALMQLVWSLLPAIEQVPAAVQVLWVVKPEIEQNDACARHLLRVFLLLPPKLQVPLLASQEVLSASVGSCAAVPQ